MAAEHTLELPMPPRDLQPNRKIRIHWTRRSKLTKATRAAAALAARQVWTPAIGLAEPKVQATFYFARAGRRDPDNLLGWIKAVLDGIVDAGWIEDDAGVTHLPPRQEKATDGRERLVITVKEATHGNG